MQEWTAAEPDGSAVAGDDQLALLFACCHPALDPASRVTLTLRVVCGLPPSPSHTPKDPATGLAILDTLAAGSQLARWPQLHIARATLLDQCGRREDAAAAYRDALALEPAEPVRQHVTGQIAALGAAPTLTEGT